MPTLKVRFRRREKPATKSDICGIAGPLDEEAVEAILRTGATPVEVLQAYEWLEENHYTKSVAARRMDDRIRSVYNILDYAINGFTH